MKNLLLIICFVSCWSAAAQDTLVMKDGRRIAFLRMREYVDGIEVKRADTKVSEIVSLDEVLGYWNNSKEVSYFMIKDEDTEADAQYYFAQREVAGAVSLFAYRTVGEKLFALKGSQMIKIWDNADRRDQMDARSASFKQLFSNDQESMAYLNSYKYKHSPKQINAAIKEYNARNEPTRTDGHFSLVTGKIMVYRTRFQRTKDVIKINAQGEIGKLHIDDFNVFEVPIMEPTKVVFYDGIVRTERYFYAEMSELYYEVLLDKKTNHFRLDKKSGTELQYEFHGIKDKVQKQLR